MIEKIYLAFPLTTNAVAYVKNENAQVKMIFGRNEEEGSYIKIIPAKPFKEKFYQGIGGDIDTSYYVQLSLELTENIVIYSFTAKGFD